LFHWLWPKIVQGVLDLFTKYWNNHKVRKQSGKELPSGVAPFEVWRFPARFGLIRAGIKVDPAVVEELRSRIPISREECFRWVTDEFDARATAAYRAIGEPKLTLQDGWSIFMLMKPLLQE
jgi:hypothetical protein